MHVPRYEHNKLFALMVGLHIEMMLPEIYCKLVEGSGLYAVFSVSEISMVGAGIAIVAMLHMMLPVQRFF